MLADHKFIVNSPAPNRQLIKVNKDKFDISFSFVDDFNFSIAYIHSPTIADVPRRAAVRDLTLTVTE